MKNSSILKTCRKLKREKGTQCSTFTIAQFDEKTTIPVIKKNVLKYLEE